MITDIPEKALCFNNNDVLPKEGIPNGKPAINMDTGEVFMFDAEIKEWKKQ